MTMFGKKTKKPSGRIDTLIGVGTTITGDIVFTGGLRIDGVVKGNICATPGQLATLVISEHAHVEGEVAVSHLVANGTITGPVMVTDFVELQSKARVMGDVDYEMIEIHLDAIVQGRLIYQELTGNTVELKLALGAK